MLTLRQSLSEGTIRKIAATRASGAGDPEDDWQRRTELLFERLAVRWVIAGLPLDSQKLLLGRYRMATNEERRWVQRTIARHIAEHIPELDP